MTSSDAMYYVTTLTKQTDLLCLFVLGY